MDNKKRVGGCHLPTPTVYTYLINNDMNYKDLEVWFVTGAQLLYGAMPL
jgi:hypothetical protein